MADVPEQLPARRGVGRVPAWPVSVPPETCGLRAFRAELRDLLMRAAEAGLDAGYRVISNAHGHGGQEVPHYHLHILGGAPLGPMLSR